MWKYCVAHCNIITCLNSAGRMERRRKESRASHFWSALESDNYGHVIFLNNVFENLAPSQSHRYLYSFHRSCLEALKKLWHADHKQRRYQSSTVCTGTQPSATIQLGFLPGEMGRQNAGNILTKDLVVRGMQLLELVLLIHWCCKGGRPWAAPYTLAPAQQH